MKSKSDIRRTIYLYQLYFKTSHFNITCFQNIFYSGQSVHMYLWNNRFYGPNKYYLGYCILSLQQFLLCSAVQKRIRGNKISYFAFLHPRIWLMTRCNFHNSCMFHCSFCNSFLEGRIEKLNWANLSKFYIFLWYNYDSIVYRKLRILKNVWIYSIVI